MSKVMFYSPCSFLVCADFRPFTVDTFVYLSSQLQRLMCLTFHFDETVFVLLQLKDPLEVIVFVYCSIIDSFSLVT